MAVVRSTATEGTPGLRRCSNPSRPMPVTLPVSEPEGSAVAVLERIAVAADQRGQGIGGRVLSRWCRHVAQQGAVQVTATLTDDESEGALGDLLDGEGFEPGTWRWTREL